MRSALRLTLAVFVAVLLTVSTAVLMLHRHIPVVEAVAREDTVTVSTSEPSPPSTVVETTTTTVDPATVIEWAAAMDRATSTTTTTAPLPVVTAPPTTRPAPKPTTSAYVPPPTTAAPEPEPDPEPLSSYDTAVELPAFLLCVRQRESGGNYQVVNRSSGAAGAFQFMPQTARTIAGWMGRPDLVARPANMWAPYDQDAAAILLYQRSGRAPWNGPGC